MKLSLVVPCYNEEANIKPFYDEIYKTFKKENIILELLFVCVIVSNYINVCIELEYRIICS